MKARLLIEDATFLQARAISLFRSKLPRAYVITPLHSNAVTLAWSFYDGSINYNGALPVSDATGTYSVPIFSYYHSFDFFGRSSNVVASALRGRKLQGNRVRR